MGFIGGTPAYRFLKSRYPGGDGVPMSQGDPYADNGIDKLTRLFGDGLYESLHGKSVLDFGCGTGTNAILLAQHGCSKVVGIDLQERFLTEARAKAAAAGVADRCTFVSGSSEQFDVILSTDSFEHFEDPGAILREMQRLLKPDGYLLIEFGYTWYHPLGGHLFSVFPWAHLVFTEEALIRWRSDFKTDGATRFHEVAGGLNKMTLRRWERLVRESDFEFMSYELIPIRAMKRFHMPLTRELFTSFIRAKLRLSAAARAQKASA